MAHNHQHATTYGRAFALGAALNIAYIVFEFSYGQIAHSLALIADAGHNLSDVLGLLLAWGALALAQRQPSARRTYGLRRSSILAALGNAVILLVSCGAIAWEAVGRLGQPAPVAGATVWWVAAIGIVINGLSAALFMGGRAHDLNLRATFLHFVADAAVSLGVVIAGLLIGRTGWLWLDPVVSLVIVVVILAGTWGLLRDALNLALDGVPVGIEVAAVEQYLRSLPEVQAVHDLHIWGMSTTEAALTAHVVVRGASSPNALLRQASDGLHDQFGIEHATLQIESSLPEQACRCSLAAQR